MSILLQVTAAEINNGVQKANTEIDGKVPKPGFNTQTGTSYTPQLADNNGVIEMDSAELNTVNLPTDAEVAFPVPSGGILRTSFDVVPIGAGTTAIQAPAGVLLNGTDGGTVLSLDPYAAIAVYKRGENDWVAIGGE